MFEAQVELSQERSDEGHVSRFTICLTLNIELFSIHPFIGGYLYGHLRRFPGDNNFAAIITAI
jgi:hypothetical protein